mmetsp:Transcript_24480/g.73459  ORF Transcript_24480/g.73459 Transcript_24480/m.73459 type:complete len:268 (-) Transcript_24480:996-1799(-)
MHVRDERAHVPARVLGAGGRFPALGVRHPPPEARGPVGLARVVERVVGPARGRRQGPGVPERALAVEREAARWAPAGPRQHELAARRVERVARRGEALAGRAVDEVFAAPDSEDGARGQGNVEVRRAVERVEGNRVPLSAAGHDAVGFLGRQGGREGLQRVREERVGPDVHRLLHLALDVDSASRRRGRQRQVPQARCDLGAAGGRRADDRRELRVPPLALQRRGQRSVAIFSRGYGNRASRKSAEAIAIVARVVTQRATGAANTVR